MIRVRSPKSRPSTLGFWIIKILATTLGETGGDSVSMSWLGETTLEAGQGGLNGYLVGTAIFGVLLVAIMVLICVIPQRAGRHPGEPAAGSA